MDSRDEKTVQEIFNKHAGVGSHSETTWHDSNVRDAIREAIKLTRDQQWIAATTPPEREGRYLIQYRQYGQVRVFTGDYLPGDGWSCRFSDMDVLNWCEIPEPPSREKQ